MAKEYIGVKLDARGEKYKCVVKKFLFKKCTSLKNEFDTAKEAAVYRDIKIRGGFDKEKIPKNELASKKGLIEKNDSDNKLNFKKAKLKKLVQKQRDKMNSKNDKRNINGN